MANMRAIRNRIKSVEGTRQITKSMKLVSGAKLRRVQSARGAQAVYAEKCGAMLKDMLAQAVEIDNPFLKEGSGRTVYVLFVGNRGLCGAYNQNVLHYLESDLKLDPDLEDYDPANDPMIVVVGSWGRDLIAAVGMEVLRTFDTFKDVPTSEEAAELTAYLKDLYLSGKAGQIALVYQHYLSALRQVPTHVDFLPVRSEKVSAVHSDVICEPDSASLIERLVDMYIQSTVYSTMLEARLGEHTARMMAMTAATDNTDELIAKLTQDLNHARQSAITTEISEIVGGAAALRSLEDQDG